MSALDRIKTARSKEELSDALEPIVASLVLTAEETLPKVEKMERALGSSEDFLKRLEGTAKALEKARSGSRLKFFLAVCSVSSVAAVGAAILALQIAPLFISKELNGRLLSETEIAAYETSKSDARNWREFGAAYSRLPKKSRDTINGIMNWTNQ